MFPAIMAALGMLQNKAQNEQQNRQQMMQNTMQPLQMQTPSINSVFGQWQ